jgi:hypothetical protein
VCFRQIGQSYSKHYTSFLSLCKLQVFIANIIGVVIIDIVHGILGFAITLYMRVLVPLLSRYKLAH